MNLYLVIFVKIIVPFAVKFFPAGSPPVGISRNFKPDNEQGSRRVSHL